MLRKNGLKYYQNTLEKIIVAHNSSLFFTFSIFFLNIILTKLLLELLYMFV